MNLQKDTKNKLLYFSFNQDHSCFACGTDDGFQIWNVDPLKPRFRKDFQGGIGIVEMLFKCNILALVGGGKKPHFPPNKINIWDDFQNKCLAELEFLTAVLAVRLRRDKIIAVLANKIYVYNFTDLKQIHQVDTHNPRGLIALAPDTNASMLVYPSTVPGEVCLDSMDGSKPKTLKVHENDLSQIAVNLDGTKLATASIHGTIIRVWDTATQTKIAELRRGSDRAAINCLNFSSNSKHLCISSNKGTIHIFSLMSNANVPEKTEEKGVWGYIPSFGRGLWRWSHAQFHIAEPYSICAFGVNNSVLVVSADGSFHRYNFDEKEGGEATCEEHKVFLDQIAESKEH